MSTTHSHIGASSYHRWGVCPGSVRLSKGIKSITSSYAAEGHKAHELAAEWLTTGKAPKIEDPEMFDAISQYAALVAEDRLVAVSNDGFCLIEHKFDLSQVHPGLFGTADAVVYDPVTKTLTVYDFKYGAGVPVEVVENEQLQYYGLGALLSTGVPCNQVNLVIVQPRCNHVDGPVRRWAFPALNLLDFASDLAKAAMRTENDNAPLVPGGHCRWCPAAGVCPALHEKATAVATQEFSQTAPYDPKKLAAALDWIPALEAYAKAVREFAYAEACHGRTPPGYKLVQKRATRKWKLGEDETQRLMESRIRQTTFLECLDQPTLKSPAQVEKILDKKAWEAITDLIAAESSGLTLVHESDKRPPAKPDAVTEFTVIGEVSA